MKLTPKQRQKVAAWMMEPFPPTVRGELLQDKSLMKRLNLKPQFVFPLGTLSATTDSLHDAQRKAISGRKVATLVLNDGKRKRAKLSHQNGTAVITVDGHAYGFGDSDLLSAKESQRTRALNRILKQRPLPNEWASKWRTLLKSRPLDGPEFVTLCTDFSATPESFSTQVKQAKTLDSDALLPSEPSYFDRLIAPLAGAKSFDDFIQGPLASARSELLANSPETGLRRIAYSALWRPLIPFKLLQALKPADVEALLAANDPFSLICGFELCGDGLSRDFAAFGALGAKFLEKLFDKKASATRNNLFAAFAIMTTVNIRRVIQPHTAPLWWVRLAALAHAGVLANAKAGMPKSEEFLKWAAGIFGMNYVWTTALDLRDAPRWRPEWIEPDYLITEIVGRVIASISALTVKKLPPKWKRLLDHAVADLRSSRRLLATQFVGPFDDFLQNGSPVSSMIQPFADLEKKLETVTLLDEVPELFALIAASLPSEKIVAGVQRIVSKSPGEPFAAEDELNFLKIASRLGAASRNTSIGDAITKRAISIARQDAPGYQITEILEVMVQAAACYSEPYRYRKQVGDAVAAVCLATDVKVTLRNILIICDALSLRDDKMMPALCKASAIARIKLGGESFAA